jgi:arginase
VNEKGTSMSAVGQSIHFVGSACGIAAEDPGCADGPLTLKQSVLFQQALKKAAVDFHWENIFAPASEVASVDIIAEHCQNLATQVASLVQQQKPFMVFGGDHSCAIGTWSGAFSEVAKQGDMGLIWIDAHMDSHTPATTPSGNIHGMPLACLLGDGYPQLTQILNKAPKVKPENLCMIGIRSFEQGEAELLKRLKIRIYGMAEVKQRGLDDIIKEAIAHVTKNTAAYGVTIDVDSMDPNDAPATGVSEPDGLSGSELCNAAMQFANDPRLIGTEIVEFDPHRDKNNMTEKLIINLALAILAGQK